MDKFKKELFGIKFFDSALGAILISVGGVALFILILSGIMSLIFG